MAQAAQQIKSYTIANLDKLLVEFERNIAARGATVLWASDAAEANGHVLRIAREHNVQSAVKSKSMLSEELELNHVLEAAGIRAVETDLGEYIVQLAQERPVHIVTPAIHMSAADVGRLFAEKLGEPMTVEHQKLTDIARRHLRGVSPGGHGNLGLQFCGGRHGHVRGDRKRGERGPVDGDPAGTRRLDRHREDAAAAGRSALVSQPTAPQRHRSKAHHVHALDPRVTPGKKLYVILLDNGRTNVLRDRAAWSALHCVRCGACLNACPVYRRVGGWAYGWVYPGPIGSILTPHLVGLKKAGELPFASSLCGACGEICPVKIDIPHQLVHLRHRAVNEPSPMNSASERFTWAIWAWFMGGPRRYKLAMTAVRMGIRLAKYLPWHPGKLGAWTRGLALPKVPSYDFRSWWRKNRGA